MSEYGDQPVGEPGGLPGGKPFDVLSLEDDELRFGPTGDRFMPQPKTEVADLRRQLARAKAERDEVRCRVDQLESKQASLADLLNTELRENYGQAFQVELQDDFRPAIQRLVDGVRHGERFMQKARVAELEGEVERLRERVTELGTELPKTIYPVGRQGKGSLSLPPYHLRSHGP